MAGRFALQVEFEDSPFRSAADLELQAIQALMGLEVEAQSVGFGLFETVILLLLQSRGAGNRAVPHHDIPGEDLAFVGLVGGGDIDKVGVMPDKETDLMSRMNIRLALCQRPGQRLAR